MSKNRKRQDTPAAVAPASAAERKMAPASDRGPAAPRLFLPGVGWQLLAMIGLSAVLGFTFNAASPVGVRFGEPAAPPAIATVSPASPVLVPTSAPPVAVTVPAPPSAPITTAVTAPQPAPIVTPPIPPHTHTHTASPIVTSAPPASGQLNPAPIHWPEAKALTAEGRGLLIDVRHKPVYDAGHIPGAVSLPEMTAPAEFNAFLSQQPTNLVLITYCSSTSCSQSLRVANRLVTEFRWPAVRYMTGGYLEYQQAELAKPAPAP